MEASHGRGEGARGGWWERGAPRGGTLPTPRADRRGR